MRDWRYFTGDSDDRLIMGDDETALLRLWREKPRAAELNDPGNLTEELNRRWYESITGRMPIGLYVVAVCYATAVFSSVAALEILFLLLLFPIRNKRVRFFTFRTVPAKRSMRPRSCRCGSRNDLEELERTSLLHWRLRRPNHHGRR